MLQIKKNNVEKSSNEKLRLTVRNSMCEISVYIYQFQGKIWVQQVIICQTTPMRRLIASYQSHYLRQKHTSYFCKQMQHHGTCID